MTDPLTQFSTKATPQTSPIPGRTDQVLNSAGGYVFQVDDWQRALRFLILGSTGGTYYIGEQELTKQNAEVILKLARTDGVKLVELIKDVSLNGRAPKQNPTLFALAICSASEDAETRKAALAALPLVARTGTHLFIFARYVEQFRGWGRGLRSAVGSWYTSKPADKVAYQAVKYQQREGWSHGDLLRLSHPAGSQEHAQVYNWILGKDYEGAGRIIEGFERAKTATLLEIPGLIESYGLPWEALPTEALNEPVVWEALIPNLGLTALIRQLGRLSKIGVIAPMSAGTKQIVAKLSNGDDLVKSRVHPFAVLNALATYQTGHGFRGSSTWNVVPQIVKALDGAFYAAFGNVVPAGKRTLIGIDVSHSMTTPILNSALSCSAGATALAMQIVKTEPEYYTMAFDQEFRSLPLTKNQRLDDAMTFTTRINGGGTNVAIPMEWAAQNNVPVDTFITLTDNETYAGAQHVTQALTAYRQKTGIPAKNVVIGMASNGFTVADPKDAGGQLDVVGFDSATPDLISGFSRGDF